MTSASRRTGRFAAAAVIWLVACAVRAWHLAEMQQTAFWTELMGDAEAYDAWARDIAAGDWLGDEVFYQAPLYPYFLGTIYSLLGRAPGIVRVIQIVLGATSCMLLASAGRRFFCNRIGITAGLLLAVYPPVIFFDGLLQKTALGVFLTCLLLFVLSAAARTCRRPRSAPPADHSPPRPRDARHPWLWGTAGLVLGALSLVRENALLTAAALIAWTAVFPRGTPGLARAGRVAALACGLAVALAPVAVRNGLVGDEWHLTTAQFGPNFYIGNNRQADGFYAPLKPGRANPAYERIDATRIAERETGRALSPGEVSWYWTRRTLHDVRADPARWLGLMARKCGLIVNALEVGDAVDLYSFAEFSTVLAVLTPLWHMGVLFPLAVCGLVATWRQRGRLWPLFLALVTTAAGLSLFYLFARYRMILVPPLMLFAAAGVIRLGWLARRRRYGQLGICGLLAVAAAVPSNWTVGSHRGVRAQTHYNLAVELNESGRDFRVIHRHFRQAVRLDPQDIGTRWALADFLFDRDRYRQSLPHYRTVLDRRPQSADAHNSLGAALLASGQSDEGLAELRKALELAPDHEGARYNLVRCLQSLPPGSREARGLRRFLRQKRDAVESTRERASDDRE